MDTTIALQVWMTARIHTAGVSYNGGPVRYGFWVTIDRLEIASDGLQVGKYKTEADAVKAAKRALRLYQRERKDAVAR